MQAPLPVDRYVPDLVSLIRRERRAVIVAPPGAGKTTRIPPALTALGRTILLQPRRVAARALARRIAFEQQWTIGEEVGWQIRFERRFNDRTRLLVATEGILTARLQSDPLLSDFAVIVLDEFHERSIYADLALSLAREAARSRDDLALVVMSATIDAEPVARFLDAEVVTIDARAFPIEITYAPERSVAQAAAEASRNAKGDVLCFLPGAREIDQAARELSRIGVSASVFPLHGSLPVEEQERALAPSGGKKIILATNVAETSLTVEGVTDVVDSGLQKVLRFDTETAVDHLVTEQISRDSADQRAGRAGRTQPGRAVRLWDARAILRPHREPEVRRIDLASTILDLIAWGGRPETFAWFERPPAARIEAAMTLLRRLGAIDEEGRMTALGDQLRRFPLHPRLARVIVAAHGAELAVRVAAALSEDLRSARTTGVPETTRSDAFALADSPRIAPTARELTRIAQSILGDRYQRQADEATVLRAILAGYPDRVALRREPGSPRLLLASGTGAVLGRESGVRDGEFVVALDVAGGAESLVRAASAVEREWLTPTHRDIVHTLAGERVRATQRLWYDTLLLRENPTAADPLEAARLRGAKLRDSIDPELSRRLAFAGLEVDWNALIEAAAASSGAVNLAEWLPYDVRAKLEKLAPARIALPSGRTARLEYRDDGSVFAAAKLQELFGLAETPRVGPKQTPVTLELLAPNGRPVQITRDLRSFWTTGYVEVRKELRGRYPKHPWPEDPWTAEATHRTKKR